MYFPALLYTCISSMLFLIDGIPIHPPDSLKNVMQVRLQADTIIHRIKEHNEKVMGYNSVNLLLGFCSVKG